jgi:hypothetical protein
MCKILWQQKTGDPLNSGVLATAGRPASTGEGRADISAFDPEMGTAVGLQTRRGRGRAAGDGKQYGAVAVGGNSLLGFRQDAPGGGFGDCRLVAYRVQSKQLPLAVTVTASITENDMSNGSGAKAQL